MTRILLVEDDASLGATLRERLIKEGHDVVLAASKAQALAEAGPFDLYIFDVGLPDGSGFELARELPRKPLVFMTAQSDPESRLSGYELGADEYIPKPFHLRELLLRVRHVLANHRLPERLVLGEIVIDFDYLTFARGGQVEAVAVKDLSLLRLLVERSPGVVSRDEALNLLWGEDRFPSNRTVDNSIVRLRGLLGSDNSLFIESVRGVGYRWNHTEKKS